MTFKPMLAGKFDPLKAKYPYYGSVKLDGIRCLILNGKPVSRKLKDIPNDYIRGVLGSFVLDGMDGELIVGPASDANVYQTTSSAVMSQDGTPDFSFWVFDLFGDEYATMPYDDRMASLTRRFNNLDADIGRYITLTDQVPLYDHQGLLAYETSVLDYGYEGVMLRKPDGRYKQGRSTSNSGELLKLKRFTDKEALVIGVEELMKNGNEATIDNLGHTKRSSHAENKIPMGVMGALVCRDVVTNVEFNIGTGFSAKQRKDFWDNDITGQLVKYKSFDIGVVDAPRFPVFLGFRSEIDL